MRVLRILLVIDWRNFYRPKIKCPDGRTLDFLDALRQLDCPSKHYMKKFCVLSSTGDRGLEYYRGLLDELGFELVYPNHHLNFSRSPDDKALIYLLRNHALSYDVVIIVSGDGDFYRISKQISFGNAKVFVIGHKDSSSRLIRERLRFVVSYRLINEKLIGILGLDDGVEKDSPGCYLGGGVASSVSSELLISIRSSVPLKRCPKKRTRNRNQFPKRKFEEVNDFSTI
ncbi:hypothetical protein A3F08_01690 [Candidatus Berkelbacteria bacterium RIFCSPHIGHO2_12_FULL_36_9]|uniref:NYN domain-containing protein n=1 Tax=Candidatus Berkelbacteria bacterium RIFCSPHIGHO2_12_FULL_36_9 TaxID=1797469 RepID=A0A1F5EEI0_9BACT|nr:MAG: hypothetical protein A3F08_01690 [Candidatus Berkelbacteria bacterium RIFCSPHIGHO2_12_FULL_36_9]